MNNANIGNINKLVINMIQSPNLLKSETEIVVL